MNLSEISAIIALTVSIISLIYSYKSNTKSYELQSQYRNEILKWFNEATIVLKRLKIETQNGPINKDLKNELLSTLSALIELGRFYFPNVIKYNNHGFEKLIAYQGYRNIILDMLVFSYRLFEKDNAKTFIQHAEILQRYFTSHVFEIVDPRKFLSQTEKITNKTFSRELSFEDFIKDEPEILAQYI